MSAFESCSRIVDMSMVVNGPLDAVRSMSTISRSPSLLRVVVWACLAPFVALGGLALLVFGLGALAIGVRLLLALFGSGDI